MSEEISNLKEEQSRLRAKWQSEKSVIEAIQKKKQEIEDFEMKLMKQSARGIMNVWLSCVTEG